MKKVEVLLFQITFQFPASYFLAARKMSKTFGHVTALVLSATHDMLVSHSLFAHRQTKTHTVSITIKYYCSMCTFIKCRTRRNAEHALTAVETRIGFVRSRIGYCNSIITHFKIPIS